MNLGLHGSQLGSQSSDEDGLEFGVSDKGAGITSEPPANHIFISDGHLNNPTGTAAGKSTSFVFESSHGKALGKRVLEGDDPVVDDPVVDKTYGAAKK